MRHPSVSNTKARKAFSVVISTEMYEQVVALAKKNGRSLGRQVEVMLLMILHRTNQDVELS